MNKEIYPYFIENLTEKEQQEFHRISYKKNPPNKLAGYNLRRYKEIVRTIFTEDDELFKKLAKLEQKEKEL